MRKEISASMTLIPPHNLRLKLDPRGDIFLYEDQFSTLSMLVSKCRTREEALEMIKNGSGSHDIHHNFKNIQATPEQKSGKSLHKTPFPRK